MSSIRNWIAMACFLAPWSIAMLIANAESDDSVTGAVTGRVTYNGCPLESGAVYFEPIDETTNDRSVGLIGKDGSFFIGSDWRRARSGRSKFRIALLPRPWKSPASPSASGEGPLAKTPAVPASPDSDAGNLAVPRRYKDVKTSGLEVTLGRESTRVDIDLKD